MNVIKIRAKIKVYQGEKMRKTPFESGYRPLFEFLPNKMTSGKISLFGRQSIGPGEEDIVMIEFLNRDLLGKDFASGKRFQFSEGRNVLGEGIILEIFP